MIKSKIEFLESRLFLSTTLPTPVNEGDWSDGHKLNVNAPAGGASLSTYSFNVQQNERVTIAVKPLHGKAVSVALLDSNDDVAYGPRAMKLGGVVHLGTYTIAVSDPNSVGYRLMARATPVFAPVTFFSTFGSGRFIAGGATIDSTAPSLGDFSGKRNLLFTSSTNATADYAFTVTGDERVTVRLQSPQKKNLKLELINADSVQPTGDQKWTDHQAAFVTAGTYFISVSSVEPVLPQAYQIFLQSNRAKPKAFRPALTLSPAPVPSPVSQSSESDSSSTDANTPVVTSFAPVAVAGGRFFDLAASFGDFTGTKAAEFNATQDSPDFYTFTTQSAEVVHFMVRPDLSVNLLPLTIGDSSDNPISETEVDAQSLVLPAGLWVIEIDPHKIGVQDSYQLVMQSVPSSYNPPLSSLEPQPIDNDDYSQIESPWTLWHQQPGSSVSILSEGLDASTIVTGQTKGWSLKDSLGDLSQNWIFNSDGSGIRVGTSWGNYSVPFTWSADSNGVTIVFPNQVVDTITEVAPVVDLPSQWALDVHYSSSNVGLLLPFYG